MASSRKKASSKNHGKVGSDPQAARSLGGKGDFGAPESDPIERDYASQETKHADPGASVQRFPNRGVRESGVGSNVAGPGSGSGGDLDTDVTGVGFGGKTLGKFSSASSIAPRSAASVPLPLASRCCRILSTT